MGDAFVFSQFGFYQSPSTSKDVPEKAHRQCGMYVVHATVSHNSSLRMVPTKSQQNVVRTCQGFGYLITPILQERKHIARQRASVAELREQQLFFDADDEELATFSVIDGDKDG